MVGRVRRLRRQDVKKEGSPGQRQEMLEREPGRRRVLEYGAQQIIGGQRSKALLSEQFLLR